MALRPLAPGWQRAGELLSALARLLKAVRRAFAAEETRSELEDADDGVACVGMIKTGARYVDGRSPLACGAASQSPG